jgi:hypothetical protein
MPGFASLRESASRVRRAGLGCAVALPVVCAIAAVAPGLPAVPRVGPAAAEVDW